MNIRAYDDDAYRNLIAKLDKACRGEKLNDCGPAFLFLLAKAIAHRMTDDDAELLRHMREIQRVISDAVEAYLKSERR